MTSSVKQLFHIIAKNWIGVILGILYGIFGFFYFFVGLGYGAVCPDHGPEVCDNLKRRVDVAIVDAIGIYGFYFFAPHMFSWSILYYTIQQDHFEAVVVVTSALWGIIGAYSQQLIRNARR